MKKTSRFYYYSWFQPKTGVLGSGVAACLGSFSIAGVMALLDGAHGGVCLITFYTEIDQERYDELMGVVRANQPPPAPVISILPAQQKKAVDDHPPAS